MARNSELIRQWEVLRTIDGSQTGATVDRLARDHDVHPRTIRRDLDALVTAGFPIYDDTVNGTARWKLMDKPFRHLVQTGFSVTELCALYFGRSVVEALTGTPFATELGRAFGKLEEVLPDGMKCYLDRLPSLVRAKAEPRTRQNERRTRRLVARLLDASLRQRRVAMRYHPFASGRVKDYVADPYRLVYALGGIYVSAFVEAYGQVRTFALERIRAVTTLDETFTPRAEPGEPFPHALAMHAGRREHIVIEFDARVAPYIRARDWHPTQRLQSDVDGSVRLTLDVCTDRALRSWILSFGPLARVVSPTALAEQILEELDEAREKYAPRMDFELPTVLFDDLDAQRTLPFARLS